MTTITDQVPDELLELAMRHYSMHGRGITYNQLAAVLPEHERMIREQMTEENWIVPKVPHDETVAVTPRILPGGLIVSSEGASDPDHARHYAAQLLAAADTSEGMTLRSDV